ncbi:metal-dependent hydrolase [Massilia antarctica]|uniref:metal-dependent hydrolase n=1 Tax=Massilia antarctica TaxID=2765360 RepID=UPI0006BCFAB4|nr:metal-dependent hydrolase [Massilia sp. H27-R4]MCY0912470.1 metal-dependent hydrolase [Massilia sp. H27-R4]CUI03516.1 Putative membrane-bound metal-dependent hydrolases [Janthinobacterium sp. CG23_2]CUU27302.1 Putative membrane-bound metal-dependent hydrolases [Janthinobacterium sp. CG23_2]
MPERYDIARQYRPLFADTMPTILSHPAIPLAIGLALGSRVIPARLLVAGVVASIVPDLDVIGMRMGIAYADQLGHRGATHSAVFAIVLGLLAAAFSGQLRASRLAAFLFVAASAVSHGLLDMFTTGGMGVALAWPLSDARLFFPVRVIRVSPLSLKTLLGARGMVVMLSELLWVWLPAALAGLALYFAAGKQGKTRRA